MIQDFRFAWRSLRRQPLMLAATVLLLGLGIGASTTLFSAVRALLLRPLPVRAPNELVWFVQRRPVLGTRSDFSYPFLRAARNRLRTVREVFALRPCASSSERPCSPCRPASRGSLSTPAPKCAFLSAHIGW